MDGIPHVPGNDRTRRAVLRGLRLFGPQLDGLDRFHGRGGHVLQLSARSALPRLHARGGAHLRRQPSGERLDRRRPPHRQPRSRHAWLARRLLVQDVHCGLQRRNRRHVGARDACGSGEEECASAHCLRGVCDPFHRRHREGHRRGVPPPPSRGPSPRSSTPSRRRRCSRSNME